MKKITHIHIGKHSFYFEEEATKLLEEFIERIKQLYKDNGEDLKIAEVETRIADICYNHKGNDSIITADIIQEAINTIGIKIEELQKKEENIANDNEEKNESDEPWYKAMLLGNKLFRNTHDRYIGGVLSGLAAYFGISTGWLRFLTVILSLMPPFDAIILITYIILWIVTPKATTIIDYTRMHRVKTRHKLLAKYKWKDNYERCVQELLLPANNGCLPTFFRTLFIIIIGIIGIQFIMFISFTIIMITTFISGLSTANSLLLTTIPSEAHLFACIGCILFVVILLFIIIHWILKNLKKCKPMKMWSKIVLILLLLTTMTISILSIAHIVKEGIGYNKIEEIIDDKTNLIKNIFKNDIIRFATHRRTYGKYYTSYQLESDKEGCTIGCIWELQQCNIPLIIESIHNDNGECKIYFYSHSDNDKENCQKISNKEYSARYNIVLPEKKSINGALYFVWDSCKNTIFCDEIYEFRTGKSNDVIRNSSIRRNSPEDIDIAYCDDTEESCYDKAQEKGLIPFQIFYYSTQRRPDLIVNELCINSDSGCTIYNN